MPKTRGIHCSKRAGWRSKSGACFWDASYLTDLDLRAAKCYREAANLDAKSPVYPSNLTAALYELGHYAACCQSILGCWKLVGQAADLGLAKKLSSRLAKALVLGLQDGSVSCSFVQENRALIQTIRDAAQDDPSWSVYSDLEFKVLDGSYEIAKKEAAKQFAQLPLFHGTPYVSSRITLGNLTYCMRLQGSPTDLL